MVREIYLYADVWLNFWMNEMLGLLPASHYTEELLRKANMEGWVIVISEATKEEVFSKGILPEDFYGKISELEVGGYRGCRGGGK